MKKFNKEDIKVGALVKTIRGKGIVKEIGSGFNNILVYHLDWNEGHDGNMWCKGSYTGNHCWYYSYDKILSILSLTFDNLQFADVLTLRNGKRYVYTHGHMYGEDDCYCLDRCYVSDIYNNDLTYKYKNEASYDIVKVERDGEVVYERVEEEKAKEMTVEEISKELGYEVKVVRG